MDLVQPSRAPILANGSPLGRFVVLGLVGRGAMGEVYAAYDPNLDRKIAIKLVGADPDKQDQDARNRLMREAQAAARISHPNVVTVYEAHTLGNGVYIAMEFVEGHTVGFWLQLQRRSWMEVLDVFIAAGRGLAAAHEKDLVHRDFKPDNVMVSGSGQVRVMDFGLARWGAATSPESAAPQAAGGGTISTTAVVDLDATHDISHGTRSTPPTSSALKLTQTGAVAGTPAYMSPEQFANRPADARSDQFSFCVALYEGLYGKRPFQGRTFLDLAEAVMGGRPIEPSETDSVRGVPGWLWVVLRRGLSRSPADRFPSMNELLAELDRRRPGATRTGFAAGAAARLHGIWTVPAPSEGATSPEKEAVSRAFAATGKAYAAAAFEGTRVLLDRYVETWSALYVEACEATHVRGEQSTAVLDLRIECLMEGLRDLTALCLLFRSATAEVVENAVSAAMALPSPERSRDIELLRSVVRPPADAETHAAVTSLRTRLGDVRALLNVGRYREGLEQCEPLTREARRVGYGPTLAEILFVRGRLLAETGRAEEALACLDESVWCAELARHDEIAAEAATYVIYTSGYLQASSALAETWCRHTEMLLRRMGGHDTLWGWYLNNRAAMRKAQGDLTRAIEDARQAVAAKTRALGPDSPDLGISMLNLAGYLVEAGVADEGIATSKRAVELLSSMFGPEHPKTAVALSNHGEWLCRSRRFAEAITFAERALPIFERETAPDGPFVTHALWVIGVSACHEADFARALPALERAMKNRENSNAIASELAEVHFALGTTLVDGGVDRKRGLELVSKAREEYQQAPRTALVAGDLAELDRWLTARG